MQQQPKSSAPALPPPRRLPTSTTTTGPCMGGSGESASKTDGVAPSAGAHAPAAASTAPFVAPAVQHILDRVPPVENVHSLFAFDQERDRIGCGMYATVYRARPTPEAARRFHIPPAAPSLAASPLPIHQHSGMPRSVSGEHLSGGGGGGSPLAHSDPPSTGNFIAGSSNSTCCDAEHRQAEHVARLAACGHVALKAVWLSLLTDTKEAKNVVREIATLRRVRHAHVVTAYGALRTKDAVFIVMPLVPGVTLSCLLKAAASEGALVPEKPVRSVVRQLAEALSYLHGRGIIHRDVKLDNVVVAAVTAAEANATSGSDIDGSMANANPRTASSNKASAAPPHQQQSQTQAQAQQQQAPQQACGATPQQQRLLDRLCDPKATLRALFVPGHSLHVTLLDFGFARGLVRSGDPPAANGTSPITSPSSVGPAVFSKNHGGGGGTSAAAPQFPSNVAVSLGSPATPPPQPPFAQSHQQQQQQPTAAAHIGQSPVTPQPACVDGELRLPYTPCGAPRFMPPEALAALLSTGRGKEHHAHRHHRPQAPRDSGPTVTGTDGGGQPTAAATAPAVDGMDGTRIALWDADGADSSVGGGTAFATASELRKADPFALGVVAYALLSLNFPWQGDSAARLLETMRRGVQMRAAAWDAVGDDARDLICGLLKHAPAERLGAEQVLQHPWLADHNAGGASAAGGGAASSPTISSRATPSGAPPQAATAAAPTAAT